MITEDKPGQSRKTATPICLAAITIAFAPAAAWGEPNITGEWVLDQPAGMKLKAADLPLTDAARRYAEAMIARNASGRLQSEAHIMCLPDGMPHMMAAPFAIQFLQTKGRITVLAEVSNLPRVIYMTEAKHPVDLDTSWNGHSIGHWEKDVLVVDTIGFNDRFANLFNAATQVRRTQALHIIERISIGADGYLFDRMTLEDPTAFTKPFTVTYRYRHLAGDAQTMESVCEVDPALVAQFAAEQYGTAKP